MQTILAVEGPHVFAKGAVTPGGCDWAATAPARDTMINAVELAIARETERKQSKSA